MSISFTGRMDPERYVYWMGELVLGKIKSLIPSLSAFLQSAILAAIQICLGAGARRTNRARNLKELVRKDTTASCAKIRVTLLNKGDDAYEHDTYGDSITVERTIALRGGYNGYKLYDANMTEKSRAKKDLDELLDKLNIQVENPVAILDQEEAKKFLTGKAADKYQFFMKATELERIDVSYRNAVEQVAEMETQAGRLDEALLVDRELVIATKEELKKHQALGKLEAKKSKCEKDFAWAVYKEKLTDMADAKGVSLRACAITLRITPLNSNKESYVSFLSTETRAI